MRTLVDNASDAKQVRRAGEEEIRGRMRDLNDVAFLLSTMQGRRFLWRYLSICGQYRLSHTRGDTHETAFNEGQRNIGMMMLNDITETNPEAYVEMMLEAKKEEDRHDTRIRSKDKRSTRHASSAPVPNASSSTVVDDDNVPDDPSDDSASSN